MILVFQNDSRKHTFAYQVKLRHGDSHVFGYEEGAFSGAKRGGAKGKFEAANGGTIFLDEIGELPLEQQVYLLRVLQEGKIVRLGGTQEVPVDVRIIVATNVDLRSAIERGTFRSDLYFRLNVLSLELPSLAQRGPLDIRILIDHFIEKYARMEGKRISFTEDAYQVLQSYSWPGNIRELENVVRRCIVLASKETLDVDELPTELVANGCSSAPGCCDFFKDDVQPLVTTLNRSADGSVEELEKRKIELAMRKHGGNLVLTARELNMSRSTLYRLLSKYGIPKAWSWRSSL
ncbi:MAG: sigma 54-interacting transcriptional regulator [Alicyclobacillaceae bacterium]|nr:sigma 54-interacting transcriptional regulator [Alicyclobacillaceae bacterium]